MDFSQIKTIAIVGASNKEDRPSYRVAKYLQEQGFTIIPVNPTLDEVLGIKAYPDLQAIPADIAIDVVDVFRKSSDVPGAADEALARGCKIFWMQEGVENEEAAEKLRQSGVKVVQNRCLKKYHTWLQALDVAIIGGGPAGLTAALYAGRAGLKTMLFEMAAPGGQVTTTESIENYPGFEEINGPELMMKFFAQAQKWGAEFAFEEVTAMELAGDVKTIRTPGGEYKAKTVILATGAKPRLIGCPGEQEFRGRGVSYCATCDGAFFKDKDVVVVGGGNSAVEEALFLTKYCRSVTIIHRRDRLRAHKVAQERAFSHPKIRFIWDSVVEEIAGDRQFVDRIKVKNVKTGEVREVKTDGVFAFVGYEPSSGFLQGKVELTPEGYVQANSRMETSVPGVFAAGDIRDTYLRQVATAVGDGAMAAMAAERYVAEREI